MFEIDYSDEAVENLKNLKANKRKQILDTINEQLTKQANTETRNRRIHGRNPMRIVKMKEAKLDACIRAAQRESVVITRNGEPVAMVVGLEGMDLEQVELGQSDKFWNLVKKWRAQKTITRAELDQRLKEK